MADYKRSVKCSGCGSEITVYMNGNFDLTELSAVGKCQSCRTTIQLDFAIVEKLSVSAPEAIKANDAVFDPTTLNSVFSQPQESQEQQATEKTDEVPPADKEENPSSLIKDLMND